MNELPPTVVDMRKRFCAIVDDFVKRGVVELGYRVVAVAVSESLGAALGIEGRGPMKIATGVGPVIVEVVTTS